MSSSPEIRQESEYKLLSSAALNKPDESQDTRAKFFPELME